VQNVNKICYIENLIPTSKLLPALGTMEPTLRYSLTQVTVKPGLAMNMSQGYHSLWLVSWYAFTEVCQDRVL
jgi:hypothetical protein